MCYFYLLNYTRRRGNMLIGYTQARVILKTLFPLSVAAAGTVDDATRATYLRVCRHQFLPFVLYLTPARFCPFFVPSFKVSFFSVCTSLFLCLYLPLCFFAFRYLLLFFTSLFCFALLCFVFLFVFFVCY